MSSRKDKHVLQWRQGHLSVEDYARDSLTKADRRLKAPWSPEQERNATRIIKAVNLLIDKLPIGLQANIYITSGYRPADINARVGGAPNSAHVSCEAIDLANGGNALGTYLLGHQEILQACGLYMEHPDATLKTRHLHLQTRPVPSGNRVFWP